MDRNDIKHLLASVLGITDMRDTEKWVSIRCPLAQWTHAKGADTHPSAGISVNESGASIFNCLTCHERGPLSHLLNRLSQFNGVDYSDIATDLGNEEYFGGILHDWGTRPSETEVLVPLDKVVWLDVYESAIGHPYLRERGIKNKTARQLQLMVDTDSAGEERILFPVFDGAGELYGFTGRATRPNAPLKVRDYRGLPKRLLLLGEHLILDTDKYIVLVEGLFDYATLVQCNYPAVAYMSGTVTNAQIQRIKDIGKPVIFFHDNDKTGIEAREKVKEQLCMHVPVLRVTYPKGVRAKDPSDLVEKESVIHEMIQKAKLIV